MSHKGKYHLSVISLLLCTLQLSVLFPAGHKLRTLAFSMVDKEPQWEGGRKHQRKAQNKEGSLFHQKLFLSLLFQKLFLGLTKEVGISNVVTSRGHQVSLSWCSGGANVASQIPRWTQARSAVRVFGSRET